MWFPPLRGSRLKYFKCVMDMTLNMGSHTHKECLDVEYMNIKLADLRKTK